MVPEAASSHGKMRTAERRPQPREGISCHFSGMGNLNAGASLGPLKNNGGFAATMMPKPGSLAINHGGNAGCPAIDERGVARPQHRICDIGAVEVK